MPKVSELKTAKTFLAEEWPLSFTPDRVKETLGLSMTGATLGRKFRAAVAAGELVRTYERNSRGEDIAKYAYNPEWHQAAEVSRKADESDRALDEKRDEEMLNAASPEVQAAVEAHRMIQGDMFPGRE